MKIGPQYPQASQKEASVKDEVPPEGAGSEPAEPNVSLFLEDIEDLINSLIGGMDMLFWRAQTLEKNLKDALFHFRATRLNDERGKDEDEESNKHRHLTALWNEYGAPVADCHVSEESCYEKMLLKPQHRGGLASGPKTRGREDGGKKDSPAESSGKVGK